MKNKQTAGSFGVIGLGRFGTALAITLSEAGKDVIAIDRDEDKVKAIRQYTDYAFVAETINMESLKETGIQNCDVVAVCIGEQIDASILITMSVLELGVPKVISKAMSPEQGAVLRKIGAEVVYPEKDMAIRLGKRLISNNFLDYIMLDKDRKKALRRFMIDEKIPADKRDQVALLADGDHIMWIIGWRISNYYKIGPDTKRVLQVKIKNGG